MATLVAAAEMVLDLDEDRAKRAYDIADELSDRVPVQLASALAEP